LPLIVVDCSSFLEKMNEYMCKGKNERKKEGTNEKKPTVNPVEQVAQT
jgi:hypothetical protein